MIIPPINTSGAFIFDVPFDTLLDSTAEYKVISIRSLTEMYNSGEDPCNTLYKSIGLTEDDYQSDLSTDVPIIVLSTTGGDYIYVPADRIKSIPNITGVKYRGSILAVDLKLLPLDYNYDLVKDVIINSVYDTIGVKSTVEIIPSTQIILLTPEEDSINTRLREFSKKIDKSYKTRYEELQEFANKQSKLLADLESCMLDKCGK
jgi:hypothetical protein